MSKVQTKRKYYSKKTFYDNYTDDFSFIREKLLKERGWKCEVCSCEEKLTIAHLDQVSSNNDFSNLKILCAGCHIKYDQKFHIFSKQAITKNRKTDNSKLREKIALRLQTLNFINKDEINVLEAFCGDGLLWDTIKEKTNIKINVLKIDKKNDKTGVYLCGDNNKFIGLFDFQYFDIIDLDAYGCPFNQLEVLFQKKYKGFVHCTFIQSLMGGLPHKMLQFLGYPKSMIQKCPTLFGKNGIQKMKDYLFKNGVNEINICSFDRKHYFWFIL